MNDGRIAMVAAVADRLNEACFCITLDRRLLNQVLDGTVAEAGFGQGLVDAHPWLFANSPVFLRSDLLGDMLEVVAALQAVAGLPDYRAAALAWAPALARPDPGPLGVFMGYDFHLTASGPKLIEINTNAGGGFLNAVLGRAQQACCGADLIALSDASPDTFDARVADMFREEWRRQGREGAPLRIAIVDDDPAGQPLRGEFTLAQAALRTAGLETIIADPQDLTLDGDQLLCGGEPVDLVYNRLVDFWLDAPGHAVLRRAYEAGRVVVTPNPHVYALYADKRNLSLLSDREQLAAWGLASQHGEALARAVPRTVRLTPNNAEQLWADRKHWFFKPARGHASKAAYRGAKLTRRVWGEILGADYVAQTYAPPSERALLRDGEPVRLKVDVRLYTYGCSLLLTAARLYQGQTTNMRTPGGGFAPVLVLRQPA